MSKYKNVGKDKILGDKSKRTSKSNLTKGAFGTIKLPKNYDFKFPKKSWPNFNVIENYMEI